MSTGKNGCCEDIWFIIPRNSYMAQWIKVIVSSISSEGSGELSEGKLTDNWHSLNMAHGTRTV